MSISLPTNKKEKWARLKMLAEQGSITWYAALCYYARYCWLYDKVKK